MKAGETMEVLDLAQGSDPWHEFRRDPSNHPASYAAVVLGRSPFMTRLQLLDAYATGLWPEPDDFLQEIYNKGHRVEALYRPRAAEFLTQELYPVVGRRVVAGIKVSASMDGFWEDEEGNWECKWLNADLREALPHAGWAGIKANDARNLPQFYRDQMEQQCLVMGKERVLFVAADFDDNDNLVDERLCWYESDPDLAAEIVAGWKQWDADLVTHKPIPRVEKVRAEAVEQLPVLTSSVAGQLVVTHNFEQFGVQLRKYIDGLPKEPKTDQDFANLADAVRRLDAAEKALDAEETRALASLEPVNKMRTAKATLQEFSRTNRLRINTLVEAQKRVLRTEILQEHEKAFDTWVFEQNAILGRPLLSSVTGTIKYAKIAEGMSGKKSVQGWRDGAAQAVADAKVAVTKIVVQLQANLLAYAQLVTQDAHRALFHDLNDQLFKDPEAFRIIVGARISDWNAKEEKRIAADRERIRKEEEAKAEAKVAAATPAPTPAPTAAPTPAPSGQRFIMGGMPDDEYAPHSAPAVQGGVAQGQVRYSGGGGRGYRTVPMETADAVGRAFDALEDAPVPARLTPEVLPPAATGDGPTMTITQINTRLKFTVTAGFLDTIGVKPAATDGNAKRYLEADLARICIAIRNHLLGVMAQKSLAEVSG